MPVVAANPAAKLSHGGIAEIKFRGDAGADISSVAVRLNRGIINLQHHRNESEVMKDAKLALEELLESLGDSISFAASGSLTPVMPGLELKGIGSIGTPVSAADAKRLVAKASLAPYGRGEETIVDPNVRRVWQLEPSQFVLRNTEWNAHLAAIVDAVKAEFGIRQKVNAQLYKLLVYEKGSFFAPHRDSEKTPGMFATLVVGLPSRHEGGSLIVEHDGKTKTIDFGGKNAEFKTQYAAFYADCQHKIMPVTAGYRVCLVYNLAIAGKKQPIGAAKLLVRRESGPTAQGTVRRYVHRPEQDRHPVQAPVHRSRPRSQAIERLRSRTRRCAGARRRIPDYQCYFALLTLHQSGEADYSTLDYDPYRGRRSYRWSYDEDDEDARTTRTATTARGRHGGSLRRRTDAGTLAGSAGPKATFRQDASRRK